MRDDAGRDLYTWLPWPNRILFFCSSPGRPGSGDRTSKAQTMLLGPGSGLLLCMLDRSDRKFVQQGSHPKSVPIWELQGWLPAQQP